MLGQTILNWLPDLRPGFLRQRDSGKRPDLLARCDACRKRFRMQIERRPLPDDGEQVAFACPHCTAEYTVAMVTKRGKMIQERITAIRKELVALRGRRGEDVVERRRQLLLEFEGLRGELEYEMKT
jgi:hypothetical protein